MLDSIAQNTLELKMCFSYLMMPQFGTMSGQILLATCPNILQLPKQMCGGGKQICGFFYLATGLYRVCYHGDVPCVH